MDSVLSVLESTENFISTSDICSQVGTNNFMLVNSILFDLRRQKRVEMKVMKVRGKNTLFWRLRR